ncbi:hypothetical protein DMB42_42615 [Nonomuraea sp. WAC 01424]|nr:hypothetical protein DMB42_42615 [Nonomuraea sp. WAC 01424]
MGGELTTAPFAELVAVQAGRFHDHDRFVTLPEWADILDRHFPATASGRPAPVGDVHQQAHPAAPHGSVMALPRCMDSKWLARRCSGRGRRNRAPPCARSA